MTLRALSIAAAGGQALLYQLDAIAGNLAHAGTVGFKRSRVTLGDLPYRPRTGEGVRAEGIQTIWEAGRLQATQRDWDLAIEGEGFFRVRLPDQTLAYTRAGNLSVGADGAVGTPEGYPLDPPVTVPAGFSKVAVDPTGFVQGFHPQSPEAMQRLGQIEISGFSNPAGLRPAGTNLFRPTADAGERVDGLPGEGLGVIRQGFLEQSNVDPVRELASLVQVQRAFELNARMLQAADEILQSITSLRRKP